MNRTITLKNRNGLTACFTPYGARWMSMLVPDRNGHYDDILLGFDDADGYISASDKYYGAIIGRVCGRISNACFDLDGRRFQLASNDSYGTPVRNHLHGGPGGFHNRLWRVDKVAEDSVTFSYLSRDGEEGYPGNLAVSAVYTLSKDDSLSLKCTATTDRTTPLNLTNHAFFNLSGGASAVFNHFLKLRTDGIIECDGNLLPTGRILHVEGTSLDFSSSLRIADSLETDAFAIRENGGFSLAFRLDSQTESPVAVLSDSSSGRRLEIFSDLPSIQVYTGYLMDGTDVGRGGRAYFSGAGIAIEPQNFPDAVNRKDFPSILLHPGERYETEIRYCFSTTSE